MARTALTGIKPTGMPHIGNYLGMIKPALDLMQRYRAYYFIADEHALTTLRDSNTLQKHIYESAAALVTLGMDVDRVVFYRQSDIPEVFELAWILACHAAKGLLNRAHAYKAAVEANLKADQSPDEGLNAGLYFYPLLMAADILLFSADVVPVGWDQKQHVEIARDIAQAFHADHGKVFKIPEPLIHAATGVVPGIDGRKMSKNYQNTIPLFARPGDLRKQVMRIVTDSKTPEEPKDPDTCNVFAIYRHFASPAAIEQRRHQYLHGGLAYSEIKQELYQLLENKFGGLRESYYDLAADKAALDRIFQKGALAAREAAQPILACVRRKIGLA